MKTLLAIALLAAACRAQDEASIAGVVSDALTGSPVAGAQVQLRSLSSGRRLIYITGPSGAFQFANLPGGPYGLLAEHEAYTHGKGRARAVEYQARVELLPRAQRTDVRIGLSPLGAVSGRIADEDGDGIEACSVALVERRFALGRPMLTNAARATTDDRGRYRMARVEPGVYGVLVTCPSGETPHPLMTDGDKLPGPSSGYVPTYVGGTADARELSPVTISAGAETSGVDLRLREVALYSVSGRVVFPLGIDRAQVAVAGRLAGVTRDSPGFRIDGVPKGRCTVVAFTGGARLTHIGRAEADVGEKSEAILVALAPAVDVAGTVEVESRTYTGSRTIAGSMFYLEDDGLYGYPEVQGADDGSFLLRGVLPGRWKLSLRPLSPDLYLKSVWSGPESLASLELRAGGGGLPPLRLVYAEGAAGIEGTVEGAAAGGTVVLRRLTAPDFLSAPERMAPVGEGGAFAFSGLPPGRYRLLALPPLDGEAALDPALFELPGGAIVEVTERETARVKLAVVSEASLAAALRLR
jgi:hypothetical protein